MVVQYLEKILEELREEKIELESKQSKLKRKIDSDIQLLELLQFEQKRKIEEMSPLHVNEERNRIKEQEITVIQSRNIEIYECNQNRINILDHRIDELKSVMIIAKNTKLKLSEERDKLEKSGLIVDEFYKMKSIETQEFERQRIARDLHDSTVQSLTGLIYKSEFAYKLVDLDPIRSKLELKTISNSLKDVVEEMRQLIFDLRPMSFDDMGLEVTIERVLLKISKSTSVKVKFEKEGIQYELNPLIAITLLRIIQEACSNAIKYSSCNFLKVFIKYEKNRIKIIVEDDGTGFEYDRMKEELRFDNSGFGLSSINERVFLLSGKLNIDTGIGKGTKMEITVPVDKEKIKNDNEYYAY